MFQILIYSYVKISTPPSPWKKSPPSKSWCLAKHPPFLKIWLEAQPPPAETGRGGGVHTMLWVLTLLLSEQIFYQFFWACHISKKSARTYKYHAISRFIDDFCEINDDGEFSKSFKCVYPRKLELKLEHGGTCEIFLDLKIKFEDDIFVYKLSDKRDNFLFLIVRMPHFQSKFHQPYSMILYFQNFLV